MPPNALTNGHFENTISGWQFNHFHPQLSFATYAPGQAIDGDYYAKLLPTEDHPGWASISAPVTAEAKPGDSIYLTAWVRVPSASTANPMQMVLVLRGYSNDRRTEIGGSNASINATGGWQELSLNFQIPNTADWASLGRLEVELLAPHMGNGPPEIQADAISVSVGEF